MFVAISSRSYEIWIALIRSGETDQLLRRPAGRVPARAATRAGCARPARVTARAQVVELGGRLAWRRLAGERFSYNGKSDPLHATMPTDRLKAAPNGK